MLAEAFAEIDHRFFHRQDHAKPVEPPTPQPDDTALTVSDFRSLVTDHDHKKVEDQQDLRRAAAEQRQARVAALVDQTYYRRELALARASGAAVGRKR
jgi:hypothetical protein